MVKGKQAAEAARDNLVAVYKESGYTLDELAGLTMPDGSPALGYGLLDVLKNEV